MKLLPILGLTRGRLNTKEREVVGTPTEWVFSGTNTLVLATYGRYDRVDTAEYFKGAEQGK